MLYSPLYIIETIKKIDIIDSSIFYNPCKFKGYVRDLCCGNSFVVDDFIYILTNLADKIASNTINSKDISIIKLKGENCAERCKIQTQLFSCIYIEKNLKDIEHLSSQIQKVYDTSFSIEKVKEAFSSSIVLFKMDQSSLIEFGTQVTFCWMCTNPYRLSFSNGYETMDVTNLNSIIVCAMFDFYELILFDENGGVVDKQVVRVQYKKNVYCINCGTMFLMEDDFYCTQCGLKRFNEA